MYMKDKDNVAVIFRRNSSGATLCPEPYPSPRVIVVEAYGGSVEETIKKARDRFNLGPDWDVSVAAGRRE